MKGHLSKLQPVDTCQLVFKNIQFVHAFTYWISEVQHLRRSKRSGTLSCTFKSIWNFHLCIGWKHRKVSMVNVLYLICRMANIYTTFCILTSNCITHLCIRRHTLFWQSSYVLRQVMLTRSQPVKDGVIQFHNGFFRWLKPCSHDWKHQPCFEHNARLT